MDLRARPVVVVSMGLTLGGGIASVTRSFVASLTSYEGGAHDPREVHIVALCDGPSDAAAAGGYLVAEYQGYSGSKVKMAGRILWEYVRGRGHLVFDHIRLARPVSVVPLNRPYTVWAYGLEIQRLAERRVDRAVLRRARRVLAVSEWTRGELTKQMPELGRRIKVIHPCVEPTREVGWASAAECPNVRRADDPTALIVGRMDSRQPGKGHRALIATWPSVRSRVPGARLLIVGEGDDRPRLEALVKNMRVEGVEFLGYVSDESLTALYARAHIYVMPSLQDGFGIVYAEAMLHGLPCIASSSGGAPTIVAHGETGILVDPHNGQELEEAICSLLSDEALRGRMSDAASKRARRNGGFARFREQIGEQFPP